MNEVKELRLKTGLSAQKFGDRYGIPMRTIQNWEYEKTIPPLYVVGLLRRVVLEDIENGVFKEKEVEANDINETEEDNDILIIK